MKKGFAFLVLLSHLNFVMFIPTIEKQDQYNVDGSAVDDINSFYEYIDQVLLGNADPTPEDYDDDQPHFYQLAKTTTFYYQQTAFEFKPTFTTALENKFYQELEEINLPSPSYEIIVPPPQV